MCDGRKSDTVSAKWLSLLTVCFSCDINTEQLVQILFLGWISLMCSGVLTDMCAGFAAVFPNYHKVKSLILRISLDEEHSLTMDLWRSNGYKGPSQFSWSLDFAVISAVHLQQQLCFIFRKKVLLSPHRMLIFVITITFIYGVIYYRISVFRR
jgi:hypothetical protein